MEEADKYCTECKKNLCRACISIHDDYNDDHQLVDVNRTEEVDRGTTLFAEKCEKHEDELIKLFCVEHDALVCSVCAILEHRYDSSL